MKYFSINIRSNLFTQMIRPLIAKDNYHIINALTNIPGPQVHKLFKFYSGLLN
jgi:hypothetical protein